MFMSNWKDSWIGWAGSKNCERAPPVRVPGLNQFRIASDWSTSGLDAESFAVFADGVMYGDPTLFGHTDGSGMIMKGTTGEFKVTYSTYDNQTLPFVLTKSFFVPPNEDIVLVKYTVAPKQGVQINELRILDYTHSHSFGNSDWACTTVAYFADGPAFAPNMNGCGKQLVLTSGAFTKPSGWFVGDATTNECLNYFQSKGAQGPLPNIAKWDVPASCISFSFDAQNVVSTSPVSFYSYRTLRTTVDEAKATNALVLSRDPMDWVRATSDGYAKWLAQAKQPSVAGNEREMYLNGLVLLKNAQNPTNGAIMASFHSVYGYKMWTRDAVFAAMILDAAGYPTEAARFFAFLSTAEMRPKGEGFHTCYDAFTGQAVGFVEPQYDSAGAYLMGLLHHFALTKDENFVRSVRTRSRDVYNFFLSNVGAHGLAPPDYSIWEESSDGRTGKSLPTSYFTFTQALATAGLYAGSRLELFANGDSSLSSELLARALQIQSGIESKLWSDDLGYYVRGIWSDSLALDTRVDSSTAALVYSGALSIPKSGEAEEDLRVSTLNVTRAQMHLNAINSRLSRLGSGIARYENDPFFYDSIYSPCGMFEVGAASPPWGVTTMFTAWAEIQMAQLAATQDGLESMAFEMSDRVQDKMNWMVQFSAAGNSGVGECVDGVTGNFAWASAPDVYEHAGVFVWSLLQTQKMSLLPNPLMWGI